MLYSCKFLFHHMWNLSCFKGQKASNLYDTYLYIHKLKGQKQMAFKKSSFQSVSVFSIVFCSVIFFYPSNTSLVNKYSGQLRDMKQFNFTKAPSCLRHIYLLAIIPYLSTGWPCSLVMARTVFIFLQNLRNKNSL